MKLYPVLMALLIALCVLAVASMLVSEPAGARGIDHPEFANMKHGGSGEARLAGSLWMNWLFGVLTVLVFVTLIAIGARKGADLRGLGRWLGLTAVGCVIAWTCLIVAYQQFMSTDSHALFLGLPTPSAIMLYGLLPVTGLLTIFYVVGFYRWILSEDDLAEYERLLAHKQLSRDRQRQSSTEEPP